MKPLRLLSSGVGFLLYWLILVVLFTAYMPKPYHHFLGTLAALTASALLYLGLVWSEK